MENYNSSEWLGALLFTVLIVMCLCGNGKQISCSICSIFHFSLVAGINLAEIEARTALGDISNTMQCHDSIGETKLSTLCFSNPHLIIPIIMSFLILHIINFSGIKLC